MNYPIISFKAKNGYPRTQKGYHINDRFVIAYKNQSSPNLMIYLLSTGKPILNVEFSDVDIAVEVLEFIDNIYQDWFWILDDPEWAGYNIFLITRYTIPNGLLIYELLSLMEGHVISTRANLHFYAGQAKNRLAERIYK